MDCMGLHFRFDVNYQDEDCAIVFHDPSVYDSNPIVLGCSDP